mmetsp:Transcript_7406/g.17853  ORF Transcript_7406/g.17853 Transcript_7406/m.17853 type:complete len:680 (-) Transcript_7406:517-2556(-)
MGPPPDAVFLAEIASALSRPATPWALTTVLQMAVPEFCHDDCLCADVSGLFAKREKALKTLRAKLHPDKFSHQSPEQAALATRLFQDLTRFYDRAAPRQSYGLPGSAVAASSDVGGRKNTSAAGGPWQSDSNDARKDEPTRTPPNKEGAPDRGEHARTPRTNKAATGASCAASPRFDGGAGSPPDTDAANAKQRKAAQPWWWTGRCGGGAGAHAGTGGGRASGRAGSCKVTPPATGGKTGAAGENVKSKDKVKAGTTAGNFTTPTKPRGSAFRPSPRFVGIAAKVDTGLDSQFVQSASKRRKVDASTTTPAGTSRAAETPRGRGASPKKSPKKTSPETKKEKKTENMPSSSAGAGSTSCNAGCPSTSSADEHAAKPPPSTSAFPSSFSAFQKWGFLRHPRSFDASQNSTKTTPVSVDNHLTADDIVLKVHCANARLQIALSGNNCHTTEEDFDFFTNARTWDDLHLGRAKTALVTTWFGAATEEIKEEIACNGPVVLTIAAGGRAGAQEDVLVVGWSGDQEQDDALGFRPDGSRDHENSAGEKWLVWRADDDRKLSWLPMLAPHPKVTFIPREALQDVEVFTPEPYLAIPPSHVDPGWQQWPKLRLRIRAEDDADLLHDVWAAVASSELGGIAGLIVGEKKTRIHIHECGKKTGSRAASLTNMKYEPTTRTWTAHFAFG